MQEIKLEVPVEPPTLSVVLDRWSVAWQRLGGRWHRAGPSTFEIIPTEGRGPSLSWKALLVYRGPVRVVHWAPVAEKERAS